MNYLNKLIIIILASGFVWACEEIENPVDELETQGLFVQYGAGLPDTAVVTEGEVLTRYLALQAPISFETDLTATLSLSGSGTSLSDFQVSGQDVQSQTENELSVIIPFIPTNGEDLVADQTFLNFNFPTDDVSDGTKYVTMILEGATGPNGIDLLGGRGNLRRKIVFQISDID
ncbi:MAG: hypothetical protein ACNS62_07540 [Candidatus Cyclobacteriaceae bacterium M3_2C_046]